MGNPQLGRRIERSAYVHANDQGLGRGQSTTAVKELSQGATREALTHDIDVLFTIEGRLAMVKDRFDTRVAQAAGDVSLLLKGSLSVCSRRGAQGWVDKARQRNDPHRHCLVRGQIGGVELCGSGGRLSGFAPGLVELVAPAQDGARHVLWVPHDSKEPSVSGLTRCIDPQNQTEWGHETPN